MKCVNSISIVSGHYDMRKNESVYEDTGNYVTVKT